MKERLQKLIASAGICSRRQAEELLRDGRVRVNGSTVFLGDSADKETDVITIDEKEVYFTDKYKYILLHKPRGYICTLKDPHAEHLVTELVECGTRVYPVGRLDKDSEGLLLLTNDGDFMQSISHPSHRADKVYLVWVSGVREDSIRRLREMDTLDGEPIMPVQVEILHSNSGQALLRMVLYQGKNRQIRRMCARVGLAVSRLKRIEEHGLALGDLPLGQWRYLSDDEVKRLKGEIAHGE